MGLNVTKTNVSRGVTIFQTVGETATGGFTLDQTNLTSGDVLPAGTVMGYDEATRKARAIKSAVLTASATNTATTYQVAKGHKFVVGEVVGVQVGQKAYGITGIDRSNADYDVITVGTTLGAALAVGAVLFQCTSSTGATAAAYIVAPKGLLYEDCDITTNADVAVVVRGTVYARRIPVVGAVIAAALPLIIFSQSY